MKRFYFIFIPMLYAFGVNAQSTAPEVVAGGGSHFSGTSAQISWTAGEAINATMNGSSATLTQGFHQTMLLITAIEEDILPGVGDYNIQVYPSPVITELNVRFEGALTPLDIRISDTRGKIIRDESGLEPSTLHQFDMQNVAKGVYFIHFRDDQGRPVETFKVIKTN